MRGYNKRILQLVFGILGLCVAVTGICGCLLILQSATLETLHSDYVESNLTDSERMDTAAALSFPGRRYLSFVPTASVSTAEQSEVFLVRSLRFFGQETDRFCASGHFYDTSPVGVSTTVIRDDKGKDIPVGVIYSSNNLEIAEIRCEYFDELTGIYTTDSFKTATQQPFAHFTELDSDNMTCSMMLCYDLHGNIVFSYGESRL